MGNVHDSNFDPFLAFGVGELIIFLTVWVILAVVAWAVAPDDRRWQFVGLTLLVLGPLGVAAAAIAQPRVPVDPAPPPRPVAAGRRRFTCPRCGAENDILESDRSYDCWRCSEHRGVLPANRRARGSKNEVVNEIDSKVADFEEGRISLAELEGYLDRAEASQAKRVEVSPPDKG